MKILLISIGVILLISCNNQDQSSNEGAGAAGGVVACYSYINNKDTILLKTNLIKDSARGNLMYNLFEKDKNSGTLKGVIKGDLLIADYTFMSEGISSVRQVVFKKAGNKFIEGFGEVEDKGGRMVFKNPGSLNFDHSIVLGEVNCN